MSEDKRRLWERLQRATRALFTQASQIYRDFSRSLFQKLISREGAGIAFAIRQVNPSFSGPYPCQLAFLARFSSLIVNGSYQCYLIFRRRRRPLIRARRFSPPCILLWITLADKLASRNNLATWKIGITLITRNRFLKSARDYRLVGRVTFAILADAPIPVSLHPRTSFRILRFHFLPFPPFDFSRELVRADHEIRGCLSRGGWLSE